MSSESRMRLFLDYYQSDKFLDLCSLPPRPSSHHYRLELLDGYFLKVRKTIRFQKSLMKAVVQNKAKNVYFTPTQWLDPARLKENKDYLISSPLYFDIDYQELRKKHFRYAYLMSKLLIEYVKHTYNRFPSWIVFSGKHGFHIYYWSWDNVSKLERAEDRITEFRRRRETFVRELRKNTIIVDERVTPDPWRVLRLPGTLHWETGLAAVRVENIEDFSLEKAMVFDERTYRDTLKVDMEPFRISM